MARSLGVYVALVLLGVNAALGLQCYSCDSSKGSTCTYGLLSFSFAKTECFQNSDNGMFNAIGGLIPANCMKIVGIDHQGNEYIGRGCTVGVGAGTMNACNAMAKTIQFADSKELASLTCHTCDTDLCNSATKFSSTTALAVGLVAACFAFLF